MHPPDSHRPKHTHAFTHTVHTQAFGANSHGQLGLGDSVDRWKPTRVKLTSSPEEEKRCLRVVQVRMCGMIEIVLQCVCGCITDQLARGREAMLEGRAGEDAWFAAFLHLQASC